MNTATIIGFISIIIGSITLFVAVIATYIALYNVLKASIKDLKEDVDAKFEEVNAKFTDLKADIRYLTRSITDTLQPKINRMEGAFDAMQSNTKAGASQNVNRTLKSQSPIVLNDMGSKVAKEIKAYRLADKYLKNVKLGDKMNEFEIQEASMEYAKQAMLKQLSASEKNIVQKSAYQHGITLDEVLDVIGIEIRDMIFEARGIDTP